MKPQRYVQTNKGIHLYCLIKELIPYLILENSQGTRIGEIHGANRQVVGFGSIHQSGIRYTLKGSNNISWFLKFANLSHLEKFLSEKAVFLRKS
jgi:hypothetical protein